MKIILKIIFISVLFFFTFEMSSSYSTGELLQKIEKLEGRNLEQDKNINGMYSYSESSLANGLAQQGNILTIFSILVAIISIGLVYKVTQMLTKIDLAKKNIDASEIIIKNESSNITKIREELKKVLREFKIAKLELQSETKNIEKTIDIVDLKQTNLKETLAIYDIQGKEIGVRLDGVKKSFEVIKTNLVESKNEFENHYIEFTKTKEQLEKTPDIYFKKMQNQELKNIFQRLEDVPDDICNLHSRIAIINDLDEEYYKKLLNPMNSILSRSGYQDASSYQSLLLQHFPKKTFLDKGNITFDNFINDKINCQFFEIEKEHIINESTKSFIDNIDDRIYRERYIGVLKHFKPFTYSDGFSASMGIMIKDIFNSEGKKEELEKILAEIEDQKKTK